MSSPRPISVNFPQLSFRELERYVAHSPSIEGMRVERVFVPEEKAHPDQYFKKEWALELYSPDQTAQLYFSVRSQQAGMVILPPKTLKPARNATRSGFDLSLAKKIEGLRIESVTTLPNERIVRIRFPHALELILVFIPTQPEAVLFEDGAMIASTKTRQEKDPPFTLPARRVLTDEQIQKIPLRTEWIEPAENYAELWFKAHRSTALSLRRQRLETVTSTQLDSFKRKLQSLQEQLDQSLQEPNWDAYGALLQTHFYSKPVARDGFYELMDYEKNEMVKIPADAKLNAKQQLERYFHLAKRNRTRLTETETRMQSLREKEAETQAMLTEIQGLSTIDQFESLEKKLGIGALAPTAGKEQKKLAQFSGKQYTSKEGMTILVGRNSAENLELTFKIARGNDVWLHVKGRPGSHAVVLIPPKKTASLETLLDAAQLCLLHSGGKDWGKTEVDYTFRKYVKKIKNQTEVSYTHNKTLVVSVDEQRLKRLYENT